MKVWITAAMVAAVALAGCGGGGSSDPTPGAQTAKGLWVGQTTDNRSASVLVLSDGNYYAVYSPQGDPTAIEGVVHGLGSEQSGTFDGDGYDYNLAKGIYPVTLQSDFVASGSFSGSVNYSGGTKIPFQLSYSADSTTPASQAALPHLYSGVIASKGGQQATMLSISSTGAIYANAAGCVATGAITARRDVNAYDVTVTFGGSPCYYVGQTLSGAAYLDSSNSVIYMMLGEDENGVLFVGSKQY